MQVFHLAHQVIQLQSHFLVLLSLQLTEGLLLVAVLLLGDEDGQGGSLGLYETYDFGEADVEVIEHESFGVGSVLLRLLGDQPHDLGVEGEILDHLLHLLMCLHVGGHDLVAHTHPIEEQVSGILTQQRRPFHPVQEPHVERLIEETINEVPGAHTFLFRILVPPDRFDEEGHGFAGALILRKQVPVGLLQGHQEAVSGLHNQLVI